MRRLAGNDPEVNEEWITDKDRFAFHYATAGRPAHLPAGARRGDGGTLRAGVVARGVRRRRPRPAAAAGAASACCTGGRLTAEDAYAYSKFARVALGTNDIDFRARPHSAEEAAFLAAHVVLTGPGDGADLRRPRARRHRRARRASSPRTRPARSSCGCARPTAAPGTRVVSVAPYTSRGLRKMGGTLVPTAPGDEAAALDALGTTGDHRARRDRR